MTVPQDRSAVPDNLCPNTPGAVAAPTAGLHFDARNHEASLRTRGIEIDLCNTACRCGDLSAGSVTDNLDDHVMHYEYSGSRCGGKPVTA